MALEATDWMTGARGVARAVAPSPGIDQPLVTLFKMGMVRPQPEMVFRAVVILMLVEQG